MAASQTNLPVIGELVLGVPVLSTQDAPDSCLLAVASETDWPVLIELVFCLPVSSIRDDTVTDVGVSVWAATDDFVINFVVDVVAEIVLIHKF